MTLRLRVKTDFLPRPGNLSALPFGWSSDQGNTWIASWGLIWGLSWNRTHQNGR